MTHSEKVVVFRISSKLATISGTLEVAVTEKVVYLNKFTNFCLQRKGLSIICRHAGRRQLVSNNGILAEIFCKVGK